MEQDNGRVAVITVIIENPDMSVKVNEILHEYADDIVGRMGIPYRKRGLNIINIVVDARQDRISALSGKLGRLSGVVSKAVYSRQTAGTDA